MVQVLLIIHVLLALSMIAVVLLQRSEGGGLGIGGGGGGGGGGMGGLMTGRAAGNLLTRVTAILAACFMATSLTLAILSGGGGQPRSIMDQAPSSIPVLPTVPGLPQAPGASGVPAAPPAPAAPQAE